MLQLQEKRTFCSLLKLFSKGRHAAAVAGFLKELCVKVVGCVGDVAG